MIVLDITLKAQATTTKISKGNYTKPESFCLTKKKKKQTEKATIKWD